MHRVNRSVPLKEQAKAGLAPDLSPCTSARKGLWPPLAVERREVGFRTLSYGVPLEDMHVDDMGFHATNA